MILPVGLGLRHLLFSAGLDHLGCFRLVLLGALDAPEVLGKPLLAAGPDLRAQQYVGGLLLLDPVLQLLEDDLGFVECALLVVVGGLLECPHAAFGSHAHSQRRRFLVILDLALFGQLDQTIGLSEDLLLSGALALGSLGAFIGLGFGPLLGGYLRKGQVLQRVVYPPDQFVRFLSFPCGGAGGSRGQSSLERLLRLGVCALVEKLGGAAIDFGKTTVAVWRS